MAGKRSLSEMLASSSSTKRAKQEGLTAPRAAEPSLAGTPRNLKLGPQFKKEQQALLQPQDPQQRRVEELDQALALLDHELKALKLDEPIEIRAIGGYALMKHGIRAEARAFTLDIDTVTRDYQQSVTDAIKLVGQRLGMREDWINNDNVLDDVEHVEAMLQAQWLDDPELLGSTAGLSSISMKIADVPTLTRAKIMAADSAALSNRRNDMTDLAELLAHQGIRTFRDFEREYPDEFGENDSAHDMVAAHFGVMREPRGDKYPDELAQYADLLDGIDDFDDADPEFELDHADADAGYDDFYR